MSGDDRDDWEKWQGWITFIRAEVIWLHHQHQLWRALVDRFNEREPADDFHVLATLTKMYVDAQVMGVRRQVDPRSDSISLARLLRGLTNQSRVVTRDRFESMWQLVTIDVREAEVTDAGEFNPDLLLNGMANRHWLEARAADANRHWEQFATEDGSRLDHCLPSKDLERLNKSVEKVEVFADKTVAHADQDVFVESIVAHTDDAGAPDMPTFGDLDEARRVLGELTCRYTLLLTGDPMTVDDLTREVDGDLLAPIRQALSDDA